MLTFEALENSKHGSCHLASTKHLLLIILKSRFAQLRGICSFEICIENLTDLVSQLSCSSHFRYLGLALLGLLGLAWVGKVNFCFKQDFHRPATGVKPGISDQRQGGPFVEPCHTTLKAHPHIYIYCYCHCYRCCWLLHTPCTSVIQASAWDPSPIWAQNKSSLPVACGLSMVGGCGGHHGVGVPLPRPPRRFCRGVL